MRATTFLAHCRVCDRDTSQWIGRLRLTDESFGFDCPTCGETRFRPLNEGMRAVLLMRGARPPLSLANVRTFEALVEDIDLLADVIMQEVSA